MLDPGLLSLLEKGTWELGVAGDDDSGWFSGCVHVDTGYGVSGAAGEKALDGLHDGGDGKADDSTFWKVDA